MQGVWWILIWVFQFFARHFPVATKLLQFAVNVSNNSSLKFLLMNVGGNTFTDEEERLMQAAVQRALRLDTLENYEIIGCGTIGRVYKVGEFAVKVKIPGILEKIASNTRAMLVAARVFDTITCNHFHTHRYLLSLTEFIYQQHDFVAEAENSVLFQESLDRYGIEWICTPFVFEDMCTEDAIVMEYVEGTVLADCSPEQCHAFARKHPQIHDDLTKMWVANAVLMDRFHLDLHAGNVILTDEELVVIDFGLCCPKLPTKKVMFLLNLMSAFAKGDPQTLAWNLSKEYFLDEACTVCMHTNANLMFEFEFMVVRNFHRHYTKPVADRVTALFREISKWGAKFDVWGTSKFASVEMGIVQTVGVFGRFGLRYESMDKQIQWAMEQTDCII